MVAAMGATLVLAACGGSNNGTSDPGTDVIGDTARETIADLPADPGTDTVADLGVDPGKDLVPDPGPDVVADPGTDAPADAVDPGPDAVEVGDPGADENQGEEVGPIHQDFDFDIRVPPEDTVKCTGGSGGGMTDSWSGAEPDQVCLFDGGAVQGHLYLQVTVTDCQVFMGAVPTATTSAVWVDVGGTVTQATDVTYEWGGNHRNDSLTFTFNGTHYRYYHWSIGFGYRSCRWMDCSQTTATDGTVIDDGCTKDHTRALDCEMIQPDGTHMPLVPQTDPCPGDPNFTN